MSEFFSCLVMLFFSKSCYATPALQRLTVIIFSLEKGGNARSKKRFVNSFSCKYFPSVLFVSSTCSQLKLQNTCLFSL